MRKKYLFALFFLFLIFALYSKGGEETLIPYSTPFYLKVTSLKKFQELIGEEYVKSISSFLGEVKETSSLTFALIDFPRSWILMGEWEHPLLASTSKQEFTYKGIEIKPCTVPPYKNKWFCQVEGKTIIGSDFIALKKIIDTYRGGKNLSQNPKFVSLKKTFKGDILFFKDIQPWRETLLSLLKLWISSEEGLFSRLSSQINLKEIEDTLKSLDYVGGSFLIKKEGLKIQKIWALKKKPPLIVGDPSLLYLLPARTSLAIDFLENREEKEKKIEEFLTRMEEEIKKSPEKEKKTLTKKLKKIKVKVWSLWEKYKEALQPEIVFSLSFPSPSTIETIFLLPIKNRKSLDELIHSLQELSQEEALPFSGFELKPLPGGRGEERKLTKYKITFPLSMRMPLSLYLTYTEDFLLLLGTTEDSKSMENIWKAIGGKREVFKQKGEIKKFFKNFPSPHTAKIYFSFSQSFQQSTQGKGGGIIYPQGNWVVFEGFWEREDLCSLLKILKP